MSLNFSAAQSRSSDVTYNQKWSETYTGKFSYNLAFDRNNYINHYRGQKQSRLWENH